MLPIHEDELANLVKKFSVPMPTQQLCYAVLLLVQRCAIDLITWTAFQQWVRKQHGAEAALTRCAEPVVITASTQIYAFVQSQKISAFICANCGGRASDTAHDRQPLVPRPI